MKLREFFGKENKVEDPANQKTGSMPERSVESLSTVATMASARNATDKNLENGTSNTINMSYAVQENQNPDVVGWDGESDPEMPLNWTARKKWTNVILLSALTLLTPFGSSMFAPAVDEVLKEFRSTNTDLGSFIVSVYLLGYAFGPLIIAPLSELYGRLYVYYVTTAIFIIFNVACAEATGLPMLAMMRFLTGVAGSCPLTVGSGTIADMFRQEERGRILSIWIFPVVFGPTLGPVAGAYITQGLGWRWNFWFLVIAAGAILLLEFIFLSETYPPVLLERKIHRLQDETGNKNLHSASQSTKNPRQVFLTSIIRPTKMLLFSPIVFGFSFYVAVVYGYLYLIFTTMPTVFMTQYGFSRGSVGLTYLGIGAGNLGGLAIFGLISDTLMTKQAHKHGGDDGEMKPEYRLPPMLPGAVLLPAGLLIYGWTAHFNTHWIGPIAGTTIVGFALNLLFMPVTTYLVDAFTVYAASAAAANTVLRSLGGALLPLAGPRMYDALGLGWGNSLLAFIALGLMVPLWLFIKYGERMRKDPRFQLNL